MIVDCLPVIRFLRGNPRSMTVPPYRQQQIDRGRDTSYLAPPAQIRTCPIRAYGLYGAFFVKGHHAFFRLYGAFFVKGHHAFFRLVWGFLRQGASRLFSLFVSPGALTLCHLILLFDPRREHSTARRHISIAVVVGRAMIRGEPAIGRDRSREPRLYSVKPRTGFQP